MKDFFQLQPEHIGQVQLHCHQTGEACLTLVDIAQAAGALLNQNSQTLSYWLSEEERQYLQRFRFPKRYNEWLSGRIAVKCCLQQNPGPAHNYRQPDTHSILPDSHGRPVISPAAGSDHPQISISHSGQYAVAMTAGEPCGIDIQHIGSQIIKVAERIANPAEHILARNIFPNDPETGLTILWASKEALKKHRIPEQPGIFEAITIEQITPGSKKQSWQAQCCLSDDKQLHPVHLVQLDQYILAWSQG